jgi:hypothetical protein
MITFLYRDRYRPVPIFSNIDKMGTEIKLKRVKYFLLRKTDPNPKPKPNLTQTLNSIFFSNFYI